MSSYAAGLATGMVINEYSKPQDGDKWVKKCEVINRETICTSTYVINHDNDMTITTFLTVLGAVIIIGCIIGHIASRIL